MVEKVFSARPMNNDSVFTSAVDLIIPFHGQYEKVERLLDSIFRLTRSNYYHVYLVDDFSPNLFFLQNIEKNAAKNSARAQSPNVITTLRTPSHVGFGRAAKMGFDAGESSYICFLNSDCVIENSNWLRSMGESLLKLKGQNVRMVSATTKNTSGGDPAQQREKTADGGEEVILNSDSFLSLFCVLCHRQLFTKCNGFFKPYPFGGYEDQEFACRMQKYGFKQAVNRNVWVDHDGEATFMEVMRNNPEVVKAIEDNRLRCIQDIKSLKRD